MEEINPDALAPLVSVLGVWGTLALTAAFFVIKLVNKWLEHRREKATAQQLNNSEQELEALLEMLETDEQEDRALEERVELLEVRISVLSRELQDLKEELGG